MEGYKKIILALLLTAYSLVPTAGIAATVGFVPSTGLWFSRTEFNPGETIRVYTVVINNDYYSLDGTVAFYDNGEVIDTVAVQGLAKESAKQIRVFWEPSEGAHAVTAKFTKAVAVDAQGRKQEIDIATINSIASSPLTVGEGQLYPSQQLAVTSVTTASSTIAATSTTMPNSLGQVELVVKKQGEKLVISAPAKQSIALQTADGQSGTAEDLFSKNRAVLSKAEQVAGTITSTAGRISGAYDKAKSVAEEGQEQWNKAAPYIQKAEPFWNKISNNNEPKRIAIVVGGIIVVWLVLKLLIRRRRKKKYRDEFED